MDGCIFIIIRAILIQAIARLGNEIFRTRCIWMDGWMIIVMQYNAMQCLISRWWWNDRGNERKGKGKGKLDLFLFLGRKFGWDWGVLFLDGCVWFQSCDAMLCCPLCAILPVLCDSVLCCATLAVLYWSLVLGWAVLFMLWLTYYNYRGFHIWLDARGSLGVGSWE